MGYEWLNDLSKEKIIEMYIKEVEGGNLARRTIRWIHRLMANPTATGDQKQVAYWEHFRRGTKEPREDGLFHIPNSDVAKACGLDVDKVGKVLKGFKEKGLVKVKPETRRNEEGKIKTETWIALDESLLDDPRAIDFGGKGNWGGTREKSDKPNPCGCGCQERIVQRRVICAGCGSVLEETEKRLGDNDDLDQEEMIF